MNEKLGEEDRNFLLLLPWPDNKTFLLEKSIVVMQHIKVQLFIYRLNQQKQCS